MPAVTGVRLDGLMRCKKCQKLIHRLVDGDLTQEEKREVLAHIQSCPECASYLEDMRALSGMLQMQDAAPPEGYRAGWKVAVAQAADRQACGAKRRKPRLGFVVPAVACGAVAAVVLGVSMSGTSSKVPPLMLTSGSGVAQQAKATESAQPADGTAGGAILFQEVVEPESAQAPAATKAPGGQLHTTTATAEVESGEIVSTGSIEATPAVSETPAEWHFGDGPADLAPATPLEVPVADADVATQIRALAGEQGLTVREDPMLPGQFVVVGSPEVVQEILLSQGYSIPAGTTTVAILWETAEAE